MNRPQLPALLVAEGGEWRILAGCHGYCPSTMRRSSRLPRISRSFILATVGKAELGEVAQPLTVSAKLSERAAHVAQESGGLRLRFRLGLGYLSVGELFQMLRAHSG